MRQRRAPPARPRAPLSALPLLLALGTAAPLPCLPAGAAGADTAPAPAEEDPALGVIRENVRVLADSGSLTRAASEVERLVRRAPDSADAHLLAAEVYFRLGRDDEVAAHAQRARALDPATPRADFWLSRMARWRGRFDEARRHLRDALARDPGSAGLEAELASLYAAEGRRHRAQRLFRRAAEAGADDPGVALDAALALEQPALRDRALRRLVEAHPAHRAGRAWAALCATVEGKALWEAEDWAGPVEVPLEIEQQHFPVVTAEMGEGRATRLLLDTGSSGLKISRALARELGLKPFGTLQVTGMGSGRPASADLVLIDRVRLGDIVLHRVPATALDTLPLGDGLLNPAALGAPAVRLDVTRRVLVLGRSEQIVPEGGSRLSFADFDQHPLVRVTLNGHLHLAMVDSGCGATVLDESVILQIPERRPMVIAGMEFSLSGVAGEVKDARPVHVARLALGPLSLENPILFEADLSRFGSVLGTDVQILFGADFLSRFDATFDYRRMELILEPAGKRRRGLK